jgi:hypothetical protein
MAAFLCSPFSGIGGAVRWSSVVRTGSDCSGVTSSCSESGQGAPGQHVEEQWLGFGARSPKSIDGARLYMELSAPDHSAHGFLTILSTDGNNLTTSWE